METPAFRPALLAGITLVALFGKAFAQDRIPQVRRQAPGYYRMILGDIEVTTVSDGTVPQEFDKILTNTTPEEVRARFARSREPLPVDVSVNTFLINTGTKLLLVDAGSGDHFGPKAGGRLVGNLRAAGYRPDQVQAVLLTHIHGDHSAGLTVGGKMVFPNATVYVNQHEKDYWLSSGEAEKAPKEKRASFAQAHAALDPYLDKGMVKTFVGETELFPGIRTWPHPGHTPGHTFYVIESRGQKLVLIGDAVHAAQAQFPRPEITIGYDVDAAAAAAQRRRIFEDATREGYWVGSDHISFPGLGHIRRDGEGFAWIPATYRVTD
jgi:glyoxylase-like metal-dependent hydrolase (beta-lactamase superfamily II)